MSIKTGIADFLNGVRVLARGTRNSGATGDKKLAYVSHIVQGQIDVYGKDAVRKQVVKSIENDLRRSARKGTNEIERMIQNALTTPDYMRMLHRLDLEEPHLRVIAMQVLKDTDRGRKSIGVTGEE